MTSAFSNIYYGLRCDTRIREKTVSYLMKYVVYVVLTIYYYVFRPLNENTTWVTQ